MAGANLHAVQEVFLLLLAIVAVFAVLAQRLRVPYPIVLVLAGLGLSFVPGIPRMRLNPDLIFLLFLPPLLYVAAWQTSWRDFRRNLVSIGLLAVGLVGFTVFGVAALAHRFIAVLDWRSGFVLGAVTATTDAIAATTIAKRLGLPRRLVEILEGESLLNDATGLLALEFGVMMLAQGETPTASHALLRLLWLIVGGIGVGLLLGVVVAWLERWIDDGPVELVLSVLTPYAAYLAGEALQASGVLSVVACGVFLSRRSVSFFSPQVRIQIVNVWDTLNFILNGIVFLLIGLQLPYVLAGIKEYSPRTLVEYGAVFSAMLIVLRLVWIFPSARIAHFVRSRLLRQWYPMPPGREVFVAGWTGMRGVVALAAAVGLPYTLGDGTPFVQRNLIVFLTFCVILVTLVGQGLTLPPLIRALGLADKDAGQPCEETEARRIVLEAAIAELRRRRGEARDEEEEHAIHDLLHQYEHKLEHVRAQVSAPATQSAEHRRLTELARELFDVQRQTMIRLRDEERIGDEVLRRLERELDLAETRQSLSPVG